MDGLAKRDADHNKEMSVEYDVANRVFIETLRNALIVSKAKRELLQMIGTSSSSSSSHYEFFPGCLVPSINLRDIDCAQSLSTMYLQWHSPRSAIHAPPSAIYARSHKHASLCVAAAIGNSDDPSKVAVAVARSIRPSLHPPKNLAHRKSVSIKSLCAPRLD